jgi:hypothetical protein
MSEKYKSLEVVDQLVVNADISYFLGTIKVTGIIATDIITIGNFSSTLITDGFATLTEGTLSNLNNPISSQDAATKDYVDSAIGSPGGINSNVQFNNGGSFGGSSDFIWNNTSSILTINGSVHTDTLEIDDGSSNKVNIISPLLGTDYTLTLPVDDGLPSQLLQTNGSGILSWITVSGGVPGGSNTQVQYNSSGTFTGSTSFLWNNTSSLLTIGGTIHTNIIELDDGSSNKIIIQSPSLTSDYTLTLPNDDGISGEYLKTNGSGVLTWDDALSPTLSNNSIFIGNNSNIATGIIMNGDATIKNTGEISLANTAVSSGSYGSSTIVGAYTVDSKGRITSASNISIPEAVESAKGLVTTSSQIFSGDKTFNGSVKTGISVIIEDPGISSNTITIQAPTLSTGSYTLTLPVNNGTSSQFLQTNGSGVLAWGDALSSTLSDTDIFVGNSSNIATGVTMNGDASLSNTGLLTLTNTSVIASSYGTSTSIPTFSVDSKGRLTTALDIVIPNAGTSAKGLVTTGTQIFGGNKTFNGSITSNTSILLTDPGIGSNTITIQSSTLSSGSYIITLPVDNGNSNQFLQTNGSGVTTWSDALLTSLLNGNIFVGNSSNIATGVTMNGDASLSNTGLLTLTNTSVTPSSYGTSTSIPTFSVDSKGRLTTASNTTIPDAGSSSKGLVTTGTQIFAGNKTFNGSIISNTSILLTDPGIGANTITIQSPTLSTGSYSLTLPVDDGTSNQVLTTNGSGVLSWTSGSGDVIGPGVATDNAIARFDSTTGKLIQNSGITIDDSDNISLGSEGITTIIKTPNATTSDTQGGSISIQSGTGLGTGVGGVIELKAGNGGASNSIGGHVTIHGGIGGTTNGNGGDVTISGGAGSGSGIYGKVLFPNIRTGVSGNAAAFTGSGELVETVSLRMYKKDEVFIEEEHDFDIFNVLEIQPKFFTWREDGVRDIGFIVEDVVNVHEAYIYRDPYTNKPKNIRDRAVLSSLLSVVKYQQREINKLKNSL